MSDQCQGCGDKFDHLLCSVCSGARKKIREEALLAVRDALGRLLIRHGPAAVPLISRCKALALFGKGGEFEIVEEGDDE